ncbi:5-amino-6-(5-phospho-D-ribitylamino)uracil phosphatase YigB [Paraconexibacter sp. AEG42_29]|uniref:5-amino-6-(5-phospho-D-ribitylamino)uracil phosphatase YigB n=1 Tax=Paraconexibacter sp. AEG42_29 TaxID=2997339 RepID=A0AAU7AX12_9ACTN
MKIRAVTLDLDDTLWPFAPVAVNIQSALSAWLAEHAPRTHASFDPAAVAPMLAAIRSEHPEIAHDLGAVRREVLRRSLAAADEDPGLAEEAFAVVFAARQKVELYPDAAAALDRLAARVPLLALTDGNADLELTGVARWFTGLVNAGDVGVAKPDRRMFDAASAHLDVPPEAILHAGDNLDLDVGGALAAGFQAAWVQREQDGSAPAGAVTVRDLTGLADLVDDEAETAAGGGPAPRQA